MATRFIENEADRNALILLIQAREVPFSCSITKGRKRSYEQNRLQRLWINEIAEQLEDQTPEEIRGYCKLTIGVPILRAENEAFREKYDELVKPYSYEQKLAFMMEPLDMPVTRIMNTRQKKKYLDGIQDHFLAQGVVLTDPEHKEAA